MADQNDTRSQRPAWVLDHMRRYQETNGEEGHIWRGVPTLLLTTTGRKSGQPTTTPLIYGRHDGNYIVVASKGGHTNHPLWYLNLVATPEVRVQVAADRFKARARTASPEEKPVLWRLMTGIWPDYDTYQARTEREIPVVILEPVDADDSDS
jgi:deazaflavin-dependent oxidoreductase (nitroreductase family)